MQDLSLSPGFGMTTRVGGTGACTSVVEQKRGLVETASFSSEGNADANANSNKTTGGSERLVIVLEENNGLK
jgi:hypothetical protein